MHRLLLPTLLFLGACSSTPVPLYEGLGETSRAVSTRKKAAQRYFDQGLRLCWGFNHDEAVRSFEKAAELDPHCAMAQWGLAFALGPNINSPLRDAKKARRAHAAAQKALSLKATATPVEQALIEALATRYADPPPKKRKALNTAYAQAMRAAWKRFPNDPEVGILFADSLMLLSKEWRRLRPDGKRGPHTPEVVATLERVLELAPDHPGAHHFYIHSVEASTRPERALPSARRLAALAPASGHLVHMPSHIYIRVGLYKEAVETNEKAVAADDAFFEHVPEQGIYHSYRAHNHHFQVWAALFLGAKEEALSSARAMVRKLLEGEGRLPRNLESYLFIPAHAMMRFGMWKEILAEDEPEAKYPIAVALWRHVRAVALANLERHEEAATEAMLFEAAVKSIPAKTKIRGAPVATLMDLARHMMKGEMSYKAGRHEEGFAALRRAVELEDSLPYAEPPGWMQPVRHALGALLLEDGHIEEAIAVYRADLARHAENGWSLHGLAECLRRQGKEEEAAEVQRRFEEAWRHADTPIRSSCFCRQGR